jgi:tetratricopeptide (TPR) repeat protein
VLPSEQGLLLDPGRSADAEASRAHAAKGESLLAAGDREGAISELARAALLDPYSTLPHRLLGRAHRLQGENEKALDELRMALWCRDDPALRREIAELLRSMGRGDEARRLLGEP